MDNVRVQIELFYTMGDSPVPIRESFETEVSSNAYMMLADYSTNAKTMKQMFSNRVPGDVKGGNIYKLGEKVEKKRKIEDDEPRYRDDNDSVWKEPYWLIPFRLVWNLFVYIIKFFWGLLGEILKNN